MCRPHGLGPERGDAEESSALAISSVADLVQRIIAASGRTLEIEYDLAQPTIKTSLHLDCGKARHLLGWQPRTSLDVGIVKTLAWWRENVGK